MNSVTKIVATETARAAFGSTLLRGPEETKNTTARDGEHGAVLSE